MSAREPVVVSGSVEGGFRSPHGVLVSVRGERLGNTIQDVAVYHAVVLPPDDSIAWVGSSLLWEHHGVKIELRWKPWDGESSMLDTESVAVSLWYEYDGPTVTVGPQRFLVKDGNLFVVRLDDQWESKTSQLGHTLEEQTSLAQVMGVFNEMVPELATAQLR